MNIVEQVDNKETKLQDIDFPYICRICQSRNNLLAFQEQSSVMGTFKLITNIEVSANPDMPQNVCNKCISKLQSIENFIANCIETENMLLRLLPNKQIRIKTEIVEPDEVESMDTCMLELIKNEVQECDVTTDEWNIDPKHMQEFCKNTSQTETECTNENDSTVNIDVSLKDQYLSEACSIKTESIAATYDWENRSSNIDDVKNHNYSDTLNNQEEDKTKVTVKKGNRTRKGYCIYCEAEVHHFVKHLERIHINEPEIELLFSEPPGTIKRKQMILSLRKRGNCIASSVKNENNESDLKIENHNSSETLNIKEENKTKVKSKSHTRKGFCIYCQTEVNHFVKHLEKLHFNEPEIELLFSEPPGTTKRKQMIISLRKRANCAAGLGGAGHIDRNLLTYVFPSMKLDQKTLIAQNDELICAFGSKYLKSLGTKNHNVVSTRMRLLAAFLIQVQRTESSISDILTVLQPQYFELIAKVICILAKYDSILGRYNSPSVVVNCTKYIKDCCKLALEQNKAPVGVDLMTYHKNVQELWSYFDDNHKTQQCLPEVIKEPLSSEENQDFDETCNENQTDVGLLFTKSKRRRISWSLEQKKIVLNFFKDHIRQKQSPKRGECEVLKEKYSPLFENKSWEKIKAYVFNEYRVN